jgi:Flp pilus assembly protein TadG
VKAVTDITRRVRRHERGAVALEFALILPLLFMILFGTIEFGRVYSQWQVFNGAAREGARCAAVQAGGFSTCSVVDRVTTASEPYEANVSTLTITPASGCTSSNRGSNVTVAWQQPFHITVPFWNSVTFDSEIEATFRCE